MASQHPVSTTDRAWLSQGAGFDGQGTAAAPSDAAWILLNENVFLPDALNASDRMHRVVHEVIPHTWGGVPGAYQ